MESIKASARFSLSSTISSKTRGHLMIIGISLTCLCDGSSFSNTSLYLFSIPSAGSATLHTVLNILLQLVKLCFAKRVLLRHKAQCLTDHLTCRCIEAGFYFLPNHLFKERRQVNINWHGFVIYTLGQGKYHKGYPIGNL